MSNQILPIELSGMAWECTKRPEFSTIVQPTVTGHDVRLSRRSQAVYEFKLTNQWLNNIDKGVLDTFFLMRKGSFDDFLYADEDSVIGNQPFAVGDGVTTEFQLKKITHDAVEITQNIAVNPSLFVNGLLKTAGLDYSLHKNGLVIMTIAPDLNAVLSWTGKAYYRCFFAENTLEYNQFAYLLYNCDEINFKGSLAWGYSGSTLMLTSRPYPIEISDAVALQAGVVSLSLRESYKATSLLNEIALTPAVTVLDLRDILRVYSNALPESVNLTPAVTVLDLRDILRAYSNAAPESVSLTPTITVIELKDVLKIYSTALPESVNLTPALIGLTLI